jgi:hypothetical protein
LEQRVAASPFAGLTQEVILNLYVETLVLHFADGRLTGVDRCDGAGGDGPHLRLPPLLLAPLALGYRSFDELRQAHHDVGANPPMRSLVDVLFPKVKSFLYTIY